MLIELTESRISRRLFGGAAALGWYWPMMPPIPPWAPEVLLMLPVATARSIRMGPIPAPMTPPIVKFAPTASISVLTFRTVTPSLSTYPMRPPTLSMSPRVRISTRTFTMVAPSTMPKSPAGKVLLNRSTERLLTR